MRAENTAIEGVLLLEPTLHGDDRGFFFEAWNARNFAKLAGRPYQFVQDNHSGSTRHVLRGLHYQLRQVQAKLVRVIVGEIFDVAVDLRRSSATLGCWSGARLSAQNRRQLWIPEGCAHGFLVLSEWAEVLYKTTDYYAPEQERCIRWNDADLGIDWPLNGLEPVLSAKDRQGIAFRDAELLP